MPNKTVQPVIDRINQVGPDVQMGYTEHKLKKILTHHEFEDFKVWMRGQTVSIHGSMAVYYVDDVLRWANGGERWRMQHLE